MSWMNPGLQMQCDVCHLWEHAGDDWEERRVVARMRMHDAGWQTFRVKGQMIDVCPKCRREDYGKDRC